MKNQNWLKIWFKRTPKLLIPSLSLSWIESERLEVTIYFETFEVWFCNKNLMIVIFDVSLMISIVIALKSVQVTCYLRDSVIERWFQNRLKRWVDFIFQILILKRNGFCIFNEMLPFLSFFLKRDMNEECLLFVVWRPKDSWMNPEWQVKHPVLFRKSAGTVDRIHHPLCLLIWWSLTQ